MSFKPWHLAAMEDNGYMATSHGLNMKVARYLAKNGSEDIGEDEFIDACVTCGVDPSSVTPEDIADIQNKLDELT